MKSSGGGGGGVWCKGFWRELERAPPAMVEEYEPRVLYGIQHFIFPVS